MGTHYHLQRHTVSSHINQSTGQLSPLYWPYIAAQRSLGHVVDEISKINGLE